MDESHTKKLFYSKIGNYLCAECGKGFRDASLLKSHTDSHKEKTLECPDCPAKFRTQFQQKKHLEVHQDVKYKCSLCSRICPSRNSLKKHICKLIFWAYFFSIKIQTTIQI